MNAPAARPKPSLLFLLPVLSLLLAAAHFLRWGEIGVSFAFLLLVGLLFWRKGWMRPVVQLLLLGAAGVWVMTMVELVGMRMAFGLPWLRLALILGGVAGVTALAAALLQSARLRSWYAVSGYRVPPLLCQRPVQVAPVQLTDLFRGSAAPCNRSQITALQVSTYAHPHDPLRYAQSAEVRPALAAFLLTAVTLGLLQHRLDLPLLLAERFWPGFGWTQVLVMGLYAAWITEKILDPARNARIRLRLWGLFSLVFFGQLAMGLAGVEQMLMTGRLHLPVPALIIAGPLYRGAEFFMLILFGATLLLVGPAWCSYLCYIGAWEGWSSRLASRPRPLPAWRQPVRLGLLALVILTALGLRLLAVGWLPALFLAMLFGLGGVAIMVFISSRNGQMTHCVTYCPMGLLGNWLGRISPFRMKIAPGCTNCMLCARACRYEALHLEDIKRQRPGFSCTLCGDCLATCPKGRIHYHLPGVSPEKARAVFLVLVISLHAVFLAVARI
jgi:ferredoxin